jgi:hypothetical protein
MNSKLLTLCALSLALLFTGCWQKSLHPFYKDGDLTVDEQFVGAWHEVKENNEKGMVWTVTKEERAKTYRLKVEEDNLKLDYEARLFKLGEDTLLNLYSRGRPVAEIPAHNLFKVINTDPLKLQIVETDWVKKYLKDHPDEIDHHVILDPENPDKNDPSEIVLTAKTEQLQKFIRAHTKAEGFWSETVEFKKAK